MCFFTSLDLFSFCIVSNAYMAKCCYMTYQLTDAFVINVERLQILKKIHWQLLLLKFMKVVFVVLFVR